MAAFSHVYIEEEAMDYPLTREVLARLPRARRVVIGHYKDIFNRSRQDFRVQKGAQQLVLAVKRPPYLYPLSPLCETYGYGRAMYTTPVLNCPYDCDFCFLQGIYPSAHLAVFVNEGDFYEAAGRETDPFFLSVAYENDLMALEGLIPWTGRWLDFAKNMPHMEMEVRTRSVNTGALKGREPLPNVVLAWSLSPPEVAARYERKAPAPTLRIKAAGEAADAGWRVRLCLEPVVRIPGWEEQYRDLIDAAFDALPADKVDSAVADVFRMGKEGFEAIFKARDDTDLFAFRPAAVGDSVTYPEYREMGHAVRKMLLGHLPPEKIYGGK